MSLSTLHSLIIMWGFSRPFFTCFLQLGCGRRVEFADAETAIRNLCSDVLVELNRIVELQVPSGFWDLFLEEGAYLFIQFFI